MPYDATDKRNDETQNQFDRRIREQKLRDWEFESKRAGNSNSSNNEAGNYSSPSVGKISLPPVSDLGKLARVLGVAFIAIGLLFSYMGWFRGVQFFGYGFIEIGVFCLVAGYVPNLIFAGSIIFAVMILFFSSDQTLTGEPISFSYKLFQAAIVFFVGLIVSRLLSK